MMFRQEMGLEPLAPPAALKLVAEINHRVVNEYSEAVASLSLAASRAADSRIQHELARAASRLLDHAEAHRALMPPSVDRDMNVGHYLTGICNAFSRAMLAERGILLILSPADAVLPANTCWHIGLVISELIRNAARHGLRGRAGTIKVRVSNGPEGLTCLVEDNGVPPRSMTPGQGQRLIRSLAAEFGGTVEYSFAAAGTTARVQLPLSPGDTAAPSDLLADGAMATGDER